MKWKLPDFKPGFTVAPWTPALTIDNTPTIIETPFTPPILPPSKPEAVGGIRDPNTGQFITIYFNQDQQYQFTFDGVMYTQTDADTALRVLKSLIDGHVIQPIPPTPTVKATFNGLNYTWNSWNYDWPSDLMDQHFKLFKSIGVDWISIIPAWVRMEPTRGAYNVTYTADLKRCSDRAHSAGLKVMLDNHTVSWAMPNWCKDFGLMCSATYRQDYINFLNRLVATIPCDALAIANEPRFGSHGEDVLTTWAKIKTDVANYKTARLDMASWLPLDKGRLLDCLDFVSLNYYPSYVSLEQLVTFKAWAGSKPLWITETGSQNGNDAQQTADYITLKRNLAPANPLVVMPWIWEHPGTGPASLGWTLASLSAPFYRPAMVI